MDWIGHRAWEREFDGFAAQAWDPLLRTGYLMTGDAKGAEDLVQETLLKVARRGTGSGPWITRPPMPAGS